MILSNRAERPIGIADSVHSPHAPTGCAGGTHRLLMYTLSPTFQPGTWQAQDRLSTIWVGAAQQCQASQCMCLNHGARVEHGNQGSSGRCLTSFMIFASFSITLFLPCTYLHSRDQSPSHQSLSG